MLRGTKRLKEAERFLEFASTPDRQAAFCTLSGYGPANPVAFDLLPQGVKRYAPRIGAVQKGTIVLDGHWWAENIKWVEDLWVQWLGQ